MNVLGPIDEDDPTPAGAPAGDTTTGTEVGSTHTIMDTSGTNDEAGSWDESPEAKFEAHARRVLSARWGTALQGRAVGLTGGTSHSLALVSGNGRIVGDVLWLGDLPSAEAKWSVVAENVWLIGHVVRADRRLLVAGHDWDLLSRWLASYRPLLDRVEMWYLDGERLERMA